MHLGLDSLVPMAAALGLGALLFHWLLAARDAPSADDVAVEPSRTDERLPRSLALVITTLALIGAAAGVWRGGFSWLWWGATLLALAIAASRSLAGGPPHAAPARAHETWLTLALALALATAVAVAHRPDADDSFYVNLVVAAVDDPARPILSGDTLHGVPGAPMALPVFGVLSVHMLEAAFAHVSGLSALTVAHVVFPPLLALLVPWVWAGTCRRLVGRAWLPLLATMVGVLATHGDGELGYGDFALLRMQQGKTMLLFVALPMIVSSALDFARQPRWAAFARLGASQIVAIGFSSTALWLAPTVAVLGVMAGLRIAEQPLTRNLRTVVGGALSSAYPLALALALRAETARRFREAVHPMESNAWPGERLIDRALDEVLAAGSDDGGIVFALALVSLPLAPLLMEGALWRRWISTFGIALLLLFFNPMVASFIASNVSGGDTYYRVLWLVPFPLLIAALVRLPRLAAELLGEWAELGERAGTVAGALCAALLMLLAPGVYTLSRENGVRLASPGPKLPPQDFALAEEVAALAPGRPRVLVPGHAARWLPLIHEHPYPLMVREIHLGVLNGVLPDEQIERRGVLSRMVGGLARPKGGPGLLERAIEEEPLALVLLWGRALGFSELRRVLHDSPLEVRSRTPDYEIWGRPDFED